MQANDAKIQAVQAFTRTVNGIMQKVRGHSRAGTASRKLPKDINDPVNKSIRRQEAKQSKASGVTRRRSKRLRFERHPDQSKHSNLSDTEKYEQMQRFLKGVMSEKGRSREERQMALDAAKRLKKVKDKGRRRAEIISALKLPAGMIAQQHIMSNQANSALEWWDPDNKYVRKNWGKKENESTLDKFKKRVKSAAGY